MSEFEFAGLPLGLGCAPLGNLYRAMSAEQALGTVRAAFAAGLRLFDTAPYYGLGLSERRLGDALRELPRDEFLLSTKVGRLLQPDTSPVLAAERHGFFTPMPFHVAYDYSYDGFMRSYEASLQRLGLARIDILLVHDLGRATHGDDNVRHFADFANGGYRALDELRRAGDIAAIGLGANEWAVMAEAMAVGRFDCFLLAGRYTLLEQEPLDQFLPLCAAHGAKVIVGGAYNSGILATGTRGEARPYYNYEPAPVEIIDRVARIEAVCDRHDVTLAAAALQFPLAHPVVSAVIPGLGNPAMVTMTTALYREPIPDAFWSDLKGEGLLAQDAPVPVACSVAA
ncbi:MAG: aldo/keto reductase [Novosphingobium sp.]